MLRRLFKWITCFDCLMAGKKATPPSSSFLHLFECVPVWYWFLSFRLINLFLVKTWFVPDEYFQSVEVAYNQVYGIGHLSWEWQPEHALRSYLHPALFMIFYWPLKILHLDSNLLISLIPSLIHVVLFTISDVFMLRLLRRLFVDSRDNQTVRFSLFLYMSNWFVIFCAPRTLSNSLELVLTLTGLHFYPIEPVRLIIKKNSGSPFAGYAICAALACLIRPTSALIWGPLALWHLWRSKNWTSVLFGHLLPPAFVIALFTAILDVLMYRRLTIPAWNFIRFNVLSSGSANFGVHPWYWFFTEGLPPVFTLAVFPLITAAVDSLKCLRSQRQTRQQNQLNSNLLFFVATFYVVFHSFIAHKEHRFLLPVIPLMIPSIASSLCRMGSRGHWLFWATCILQIPLAIYFGMYHQKAPGELINYLNKELNANNRTNDPPVLISQLMPCYSMPQYAAIHPHGLEAARFRMLDCTPQFDKTQSTNKTRDESDLFHFDPIHFVRLHWKELGQSEFIIAYERPFKQMESFLRSHGFTLTERFYNTRFPVSERQDSWVVVATKHTT
ncbi:Mannosyltransferase [Aphelenchoides bicaudatus]|nr:Mannosyltransferase [Aphelenchoides bicaudatus]